MANAVKPDTFLGWYRRLIACKFDESKLRRYPGRPRIDDEEEVWSKLILLGEASLKRAHCECLVHYHVERNHQGKDNILLFPTATKAMNGVNGSVGCKERVGGLLNYYHREAA